MTNPRTFWWLQHQNMRGSSVDVKLSASEDCNSTPTQQLHYNTIVQGMQALKQRNLINEVIFPSIQSALQASCCYLSNIRPLGCHGFCDALISLASRFRNSWVFVRQNFSVFVLDYPRGTGISSAFAVRMNTFKINDICWL